MRKNIFTVICAAFVMLFTINVAAKDSEDNKWKVVNYVDKYGNSTEDQYITNEYYIWGTFSNSAATDSELKVQLGIDKEYAYIVLYEYGDNIVKNYYSKDKIYSLAVLDSEGEEHTLNCRMYSEGNRLYIDNKDELCRILEYGGETSFYIKEKDGMSEYKFTINLPEDFSDMYSKIGGEFQNNEDYEKYLQDESAKHINGKIEISLNPKDESNLECILISEIPDGTIIKLTLFKNYKVVDEIDQKIENGKISWIFENQLEGTVSGDEFSVDTKIIFEEQSEEIQQKLGRGAFKEFCYLDGVESEYYGKHKIATLNYATYTVG